MDITKHAFDRYAKRILGYEDQLAARQYINSNIDKVTKDVNKLIEYSELIWTGQINGDRTTKNYYYNNGVILVVESNNLKLITLYKVDFSFGKELDKLIAQKLLDEILDLRQKMTDKKKEIEETVKEKKIELENIDNDLNYLKEQMKLMEFKKQSKEDEIKTIYNDVSLMDKQIESKALKLCNSLEYKKELEKIAK